MANLKWTGGAGNKDIGDRLNWQLTDPSTTFPSNGNPASAPGANDVCYILPAANVPPDAIGICYGGLVKAIGYMGQAPTMNGGTWQGRVEPGAGIAGGVYNGEVVLQGQQASPYGVSGGTFNGALSMQGYGLAMSGGVTPFVLNGKIRFTPTGSWAYSPNSPEVAPASQVVSPTTNLGVTGTYVPPAGGGGGSSSGPMLGPSRIGPRT